MWPNRRNLAKYKPIPADLRSSNHYYFYGWATSDERLTKLLIKHNMPVPNDSMYARVCAIRHLERLSGYPFICHVYGKVDSEGEAQGQVIHTEEGRALDVLAISCTRSRRLFWRRPSTQELDVLIELLGEEPRWIEDYETKENFVMELME